MRRLGLSPTVAAQIQRYRTDRRARGHGRARRGGERAPAGGPAAGRAAGLRRRRPPRGALRRPLAGRLGADARAGLAVGPRRGGSRFAPRLGWRARCSAASSARRLRATEVRMTDPLSILALPDGAACAFYGSAYGELLRCLTGVRGRHAARALPLPRRRRLRLAAAPRRRSTSDPRPPRPPRARWRRPAWTAGCCTPFTGSIRWPTRVLGLEGSIPGGCSCCCRARASRSRWRTGSSCAAVEGFPGRVLPYSRWQELHAALGPVVAGKRLAMEISPEDAVPYLDRVPYGVIELLRRLGATIVPSGALVSRFAAGWTAARAGGPPVRGRGAGRGGAGGAGARGARGRRGLTESGLQARVVAAAEARGLVFDTLPIVGFGPNSANPHYEPHAGRDATLRRARWCCSTSGRAAASTTVFADQTWMGFAGSRVPAEVSGCGRRCATRATRRWRRCRARRRPAGRSRGSRPTARRGRWWRRRASASGSCTGPGTRSTATCTAPVRTSTTTRPTTTAAGARRRVLGGAGHLPAGRVRGAERGQHALGRGGPGGDAAGAADPADRRAGRRRERGESTRPFPNPTPRIRIASVVSAVVFSRRIRLHHARHRLFAPTPPDPRVAPWAPRHRASPSGSPPVFQ